MPNSTVARVQLDRHREWNLGHIMLSRPRIPPAGFIAPCLPSSAPQPPSGAMWLHEIKHDGFRVIARKDGAKVRLYSRPGRFSVDRGVVSSGPAVGSGKRALLTDRAHDARSRAAVAYGALHLLHDCLVVRGNRR